MIAILFFFFQNLSKEPVIKEAFRLVCAKKLISDMYCDMDEYISSRIDKRNMLEALTDMDSPYVKLYQKSYPNQEDAYSQWSQFKETHLSDMHLNYTEAKAIVNWIYRAYQNAEQRKDKTKEMLAVMSQEFRIEKLTFADTIIYIKSAVEVHIISSFTAFCKKIQDLNQPERSYYYRGHADTNYVLLPSVMRSDSWQIHEREMYNEILIECPQDFSQCSSHLDYLVHMQHYGLPTRLLDITRNPLVALYFACESAANKQGEVIVFDVEKESIKYPGSDTVTVLASLPLFTKKAKDDFLRWAENSSISEQEFNKLATRLLHEVKLEKPAFQDEIVKEDLTNCFFVLSEKKNNRIIKQDGAFIICGLFGEKTNPINQHRYRQNKKIQIFIIKAKAKKGILNMLNKISINQASLFPEISDVAAYIKGNY